MNFTGLNSDMKITLEIILTLIKVERSSFILSKFRCFSIWTCHIFDTPLGIGSYSTSLDSYQIWQNELRGLSCGSTLNIHQDILKDGNFLHTQGFADSQSSSVVSYPFLRLCQLQNQQKFKICFSYSKCVFFVILYLCQ